MPASSEACVLHIQESLQSSLSKGAPPSSLDQRLASSANKILMQKIKFRPAEHSSQSYQLQSLRAKYTPLNAHAGKGASPEVVEGYKSPESVNKMVGESLPTPKVVLYPPDKVALDWAVVRRVGAGLINLGNTCFLNSTLQCLTYCAPLVNHLAGDNHQDKCKQAGFCMLCELQRHIKRCSDNAGSPIKPHSIVQKLRVIAKHMHLGRQEDAHEFLRYVVDHMQKSCLFGYPKLDNYSKETTAINQIFGGYLRSQVVCLRCKGHSNTYDPFLDLSLDIKNVPTVLKALERYVQPERLDTDNAYSCTKCKQKVPAQKRFTIHKAPNVLTVQLKRFDCSRPSAKVTRHVQFPEKMDLRPYTSNRGDAPVMYQLYAVLVHSGFSCNSGHYYCYVRAPNRTWYCMNDQHVSESSIHRVLSAEAYLLFYQRIKTAPPANQPKGPMIGPKLPVGGLPSNKIDNLKKQQPIGNLSNDIGSPISRKPLQKTSTVVSGNHKPAVTATTTSNSKPEPKIVPSTSKADPRPIKAEPRPAPSVIPAANQREKVSFEMKPKQESEKSTGDGKPRLVIHIKHGKVCYNSVEEKKLKQPKQLVPYNGESESEEEDEKDTKPDVRHTKSEESKSRKFEPVVDDSLCTTRTVPGSYGPLDKMTNGRKDRRSKDDTHDLFTSQRGKQLRRSFSDDGLTVETSPSKLKSTTRWTILDSDSQISPSLASGSSQGSINSTTEWHVRNKHKLAANNQDVQHHSGWIVTPTKSPQQPHSGKSRENGVQSSDSEATGKLSVTLKKQTSASSINTDESERRKVIKTSNSDSEHSKDKTKRGSMFPFKLSCMSTATDSPMSERQPLLRVGSKPYDLSVYDFDDGDEEASTKMTFHRSKSNQQAGGEDRAEDEDEEEEEGEITDHHKKHKKHKKNKKKHKREHGEACDDDDGSAHKKKKKKKKHKKKKYEQQEDSDSEGDRRRRRESEDRRRGEHERPDEEYTWVERSVDGDKAKPHKPAVPVYQWDQHSKDSHRPHKAGPSAPDAEPRATATVTSWDGSRQGNGHVVSELTKNNMWGYGTQVSSWEGSRSHLDQEVDKDRRGNHKRRWSDEYEEDMDRGKVKKVKHPPQENGYNGNHGNMFQRHQDARNQDKERRKSGFLSPDRDHRPSDRYRDNRDYDHKHSHKSGYHGHHNRDHHNHHSNHRDNYHKSSYHGHHDRH